jgi:DNA polymerase alpha subunit B
VANTEIKKLSYRPMAMHLSEASEILDDRIDEFLSLVQDYHNLEDSAFGSAANQSTSEIVAVGRIASDAADGKLNAASLVLEMSRRTGAGLRVPLRIDSLPGYAFFPGEMVALRGINPSGDYFTVHSVLDMPLLPVAASTSANLEAVRTRLNGGPDAMEANEPRALDVLWAAGPYSADDNLEFEPLQALCEEAANSFVDCLVLVGPFLDIDHPLIATGDFDLPPHAMTDPDTATLITAFQHFVGSHLHKLAAASPSTTIVLVPSVRDAISKHVSWPQSPFARKELELPKSVKFMGNPMFFSMNEIMAGVSSQDILWQLKAEEVVGGKQKDGGLARVARYLVEQRHFFPLFPPTARSSLPKTGVDGELTAGAMLDTSYLKLGEWWNLRPDILVVPSALPPFAKVRSHPTNSS